MYSSIVHYSLKTKCQDAKFFVTGGPEVVEIMQLLVFNIHAGIFLCMRPANERRRYMVTSSLIGWAHTQNSPYPCGRKW